MTHILLQATDDPGVMDFIMTAPVASFIFAITIATSLWAFYNDTLYANLILHPASVSRGQRVYTGITSGMIHADYMHLFFNMLSYYFFAFQLEPTLGHWQFGVLYVVSLILSDLPTVYKHRNDDWYHSLGASGAVSAVIFSDILFDPMQKLGMLGLPPQLSIPGIIYGVLYLVYCNYMAKRGNDNINHDAHMFGALSGLLITMALAPHVVHTFIEQISAGVQSWFH